MKKEQTESSTSTWSQDGESCLPPSRLQRHTITDRCMTIFRHTAFKTASGSGSDGAVLPLSKLYST